MPTHHPGTFVHHNNVDNTNVPWALTTHLLSLNHEQFLRATRHPFLAKAANGTIPKELVASWLANDRVYILGYISTISDLLSLVRKSLKTSQTPGTEPDIETRLVAWLEDGLRNGEREVRFFQEVAEIYKLDIPQSPLPQNLKVEGLQLYERLFANVAAQQPHAFIPWLEGAVLLWATEKCYYEAWSWARRQDAQSSPRTFDNDPDGGAMRREFIPNWSNRDFMMFVEQLERILNEGVSEAVGRDDARWLEVKTRADAVWKAVVDAEERFWPDVPGATTKLRLEEGVGAGVSRDVNGSALNGAQSNAVSDSELRTFR